METTKECIFLSLIINGIKCPVEGLVTVDTPENGKRIWWFKYRDGTQIMASGDVSFEFRRLEETYRGTGSFRPYGKIE